MDTSLKTEQKYIIIMNDNKNINQMPEGFKIIMDAIVAELKKQDPEGQRRRVEEYKKYLNL